MEHSVPVRQHALHTGLLIAAVLLCSAPVYAQNTDSGKDLYAKHCLVCHGPTGKGDGPLANTTLQRVADITRLKKNNQGVFPAGRVRRIIDGRETSETHGPRDMPHWGTLYRDEAVATVGKGKPAKAYEAYIDKKIDRLINYLEGLQK